MRTFGQMKTLKKVQKLDIFWRKVILFTVLFVLAFPMVVLVARRVVVRARDFNSQALFQQFEAEEIEEGLGQSFLQIQEAQEELQEQMRILQEMSTTSTSTFDIATSSQE